MVHRGYTSEPGGHATCPFDFYKKWVNDPEGLRDQVEMLTRDADQPEKASTAKIAPPARSPMAAKG